MYNQFFGLNDDPFRTAPEPKYLFLTPAHRQALVGLTYALLTRKWFVLLVGDVGTGKTVLLTTAAERIPATRVQFSILADPPRQSSDILEAVLSGFGIEEIPSSKVQRLSRLDDFLRQCDQDRKIPVLIIDEAHTLSPEALEEVRLLGNLRYLQIVLAGQPEINDILELEPLLALKQRISLRLTLDALSPPEVEGYISHRWQKSGGGQSLPFTQDAVVTICRSSKGVPRLINAICDQALLLACEQRSRSIRSEHVFQSLAQLDLTDSAAEAIPVVDLPAPTVRAAGAAFQVD